MPLRHRMEWLVLLPCRQMSPQNGCHLLANPLPGKHELVAPHDSTTVQHFYEPTVVECLQRRYAVGHIYTATGPVLLALNPFDALTDLYNEERMEAYWTLPSKVS